MRLPLSTPGLLVLRGSGMPKCGSVLAVVKAKPYRGWPAASLDLCCGARRWAVVPEPGGLGRGQLQARMARRVIGGVTRADGQCVTRAPQRTI
jgi:hypothetical protein